MSTGIGAGSAGSGLSGIDGVVVGTTSKKTIVPAMRYEGSAKDWVLDVNGNFRAVSPNEQAVALSMSVKQGDIKSSPTTGNTLYQIEYLGSANIGADVTNRVMQSNPIARLVADGSISIDKVDYSTKGKKLAVAVYFRDLDVDPNIINRVNWST